MISYKVQILSAFVFCFSIGLKAEEQKVIQIDPHKIKFSKCQGFGKGFLEFCSEGAARAGVKTTIATKDKRHRYYTFKDSKDSDWHSDVRVARRVNKTLKSLKKTADKEGKLIQVDLKKLDEICETGAFQNLTNDVFKIVSKGEFATQNLSH